MNALRVPVQRRTFAAALLAFSLAAPLARADDVNPAALVAARELFRQGTEDVDAGRFAEGLEKFRRVAAVKETPAVRFNIARCEESLGKTGTALADFELAEREAKADPQHAADDIAKLAHEHADGLRPRVPRLSVTAPTPAPEGWTATLDGGRLGEGTFGVLLPVDPGQHTVQATAPGRPPFRAEITVGAGEAKMVPITFPAAAPLPPPPDGEKKPPPEPSDRGGAQRTIGWVTMGAGGAFLLASGGVALLHNSAVTDLNNQCPGGHCTPKTWADGQSTQSRARTEETISWVFLAASGVAIATGAVLVLTAPHKTEQPAPAAFLVPGAPNAPAGLSLHAWF